MSILYPLVGVSVGHQVPPTLLVLLPFVICNLMISMLMDPNDTQQLCMQGSISKKSRLQFVSLCHDPTEIYWGIYFPSML